MKTLTKTLSALALTATLTSAAFAGPGDAYAAFGTSVSKKEKAVQIALFRSNSAEKTSNVKTVVLPNPNPKIQAPLVIRVSTDSK